MWALGGPAVFVSAAAGECGKRWGQDWPSMVWRVPKPGESLGWFSGCLLWRFSPWVMAWPRLGVMWPGEVAYVSYLPLTSTTAERPLPSRPSRQLGTRCPHRGGGGEAKQTAKLQTAMQRPKAGGIVRACMRVRLYVLICVYLYTRMRERMI